MRCPSCGKDLPESIAFCTQCGTKLDATWEGTAAKSSPANSDTDHAIKEKHKGKRKPSNKKRLWVIAGALLIAVAVGAAAFLFFANKDLNQFKSAVKGQELSSAIQYYNEFALEDRMKAKTWLREYLQALENDYYDGKYAYTDAKSRIDDLRQFDFIQTDAANALDRIELDNNATIAYKQAQQYAEEEKWQQAYETLSELSTTYRNYDEAAALRSDCAKKYKESVLAQCETLSAAGDYKALIPSLLSALKILPNDTELVLKLQSYTDQFADATLSQAEKLAQEGNYSGAVDLLTEALSIRETDSLHKAIESYDEIIDGQEFQQLKAECEQKYSDSGAETVISYLNGLNNQESFDEKRMLLLRDYQQKYVDEVLKNASAKADERDFEGAIRLLQNARNVYDTSTLQQAISDYEEYLPIDLADCHVLDCSGYSNPEIGEEVTDVFGNTYTNAVCCTGRARDPRYVIFYPNHRYLQISGTIAPYDCDSSMSGYIRIYADDEQIYQSPEIHRTTEPFQFDVEISSCSQLKIEFHQTTDALLDTCGVVISAKLS